MNLEHPVITEILRNGYPKEYQQYDQEHGDDIDDIEEEDE